MVKKATEIFRDFETDGVSSSGAHKPIKADIRDWGTALEISVPPFTNVAAMVASTTLVVGNIVRTLGYYAAGDGGGNTYQVVAAATGTADGGSYINLTGSGLQAAGCFASNTVPCEVFGAVNGREASAAIAAANAYAISLTYLQTAGLAGPASRTRVKLTMSSAVQIKDQITLSNTDGVGLDVDFRGGLIVCVTGGNLTATAAAIRIYGSSSTRHLCRVHCNKLCSGYEINYSANSHTYGIHARWVASNVNAYGVKEGQTNRGHVMHMPIATEWEANNPEADDHTAYLATGVLLDGFDSVVYGGQPGFCGIAYRFSVNSGLVQLIQPHPFCNNARNQAAYPRHDPITIKNESTNRNWVIQPYVDSGYIVDDTGALQVIGGFFFISSEAAPGMSEPYIRIKSTATRSIYQNLSSASFGYYDSDYKTINADGSLFVSVGADGIVNDGSLREFMRQRTVFYNNSADAIPNVIEAAKTGAAIKKRQNFAGSKFIEERSGIVSGAPQREIRARTLRVNGVPNSEDASLLMLGDSTDGFRKDHTTGSLHMLVSGAIRWSLNGTTYAFVPGVDNTYSVGAASLRSSVIYAGSGTINTSDERCKTEITDIPEAVLDAWADVNWRQFKFKDAVDAKSDNARLHTGAIAQAVISAFKAHGLDAMNYGLLCYDKWDASPEVTETRQKLVTPAVIENDEVVSPAVYEDETVVIKEAIAAGDRFGVRYEEALCVEAAYQRRRADSLEARIAALEAKCPH